MSRETNGIRMVPQFQTKQRGVRHLDTPMRTLTGCTVAPRLWQMTWQNPEIFGLGSQVHCPTIAWSQDSCHREFAPGDLCSRTPRAAGGVEGLHEGIGCCFLDAGDGGSRLQLPSGTVFLFLPSYYIYIVVYIYSCMLLVSVEVAGASDCRDWWRCLNCLDYHVSWYFWRRDRQPKGHLHCQKEYAVCSTLSKIILERVPANWPSAVSLQRLLCFSCSFSFCGPLGCRQS